MLPSLCFNKRAQQELPVSRREGSLDTLQGRLESPSGLLAGSLPPLGRNSGRRCSLSKGRQRIALQPPWRLLGQGIGRCERDGVSGAMSSAIKRSEELPHPASASRLGSPTPNLFHSWDSRKEKQEKAAWSRGKATSLSRKHSRCTGLLLLFKQKAASRERAL